MSKPTTSHTLTLDRNRLIDFTNYLALEGVTLRFDDADLEGLLATRAKCLELAGTGAASTLDVGAPDVEFLGLDGLHELDVDTVTIDASGRIVIHAEVRHGEDDAVEVVVGLDELRAAARPK